MAPQRNFRTGDPAAKAAADHPSPTAHRFNSTTGKLLQRSERRGTTKALSGKDIRMLAHHRTLAQIIREITGNGVELVIAVNEVLQEAIETRNLAMILDAATWMADRGFGKPVQVTQLTDAEGSPVAFTLWQPVAGIEDTLRGRSAYDAERIVDVAADRPVPPPELLPAPAPIVPLTPTDAPWERGIAKEWASDDKRMVTE